ncbi:hypothetical protein E2C01_028156 [Portunus trituberculatus]|uniref:Uncharacterized protein n=1 Tax=Portunus trituberculatus TaxID=210409 RepID=A0A5B7ENG3_PORTR|nr:hypothetical protein [Portunus trituberculatus]
MAHAPLLHTMTHTLLTLVITSGFTVNNEGRLYLNLNYNILAPEDVHTLIHLGINFNVLVVFLVLNKPLLAFEGQFGGAGEDVLSGGSTAAGTRLFDKRFGSLTQTWVLVSLHVISHLQNIMAIHNWSYP